MYSLPKTWDLVTKYLYGQEYIDEISDFLQKHKINTILECGCGGGHILHGLAKKGFSCLGIDSNQEMINSALENYDSDNLEFRLMNWLEINKLQKTFDAVVCRGNTLATIDNWDTEYLNNPEESRKKIKESIGLFFQKINDRGLLYVDCISPKKEYKRKIEIQTPDIQLKGKIEYSWQNVKRKVSGEGNVFGKNFNGSSVSYMLTLNELENMVRSYSPPVVWKSKINSEKDYEVLCAQK